MPPEQLLSDWVARLHAHHQAVLDGPMRGLPVVHPHLRVQAVGWTWVADAPVAEGLLITPWCMNLARLHATTPPGATPGAKRTHPFGTERFDFIGTDVEGCGWLETCSLFSPMFDFADHAQALATAEAVLAQLRPTPAPTPVPTPAAPAQAPVNTARRRWLLGGRATGGTA
jgi:[NiFe] hydrogenase assembly HybE family chaperone